MNENHVDTAKLEEPTTPPDADSADAPAWEMIAAGRYRPRRIKGSYRGRELG
jgi:hypothetical protein